MTEGIADPAPERPLLHIVRGDPSAQELAALLAVVAAYAAPVANDRPHDSPSAWSSPAAALRKPARIGLGAWMTSGWQSGIRTRADW